MINVMAHYLLSCSLLVHLYLEPLCKVNHTFSVYTGIYREVEFGALEFVPCSCFQNFEVFQQSHKQQSYTVSSFFIMFFIKHL